MRRRPCATPKCACRASRSELLADIDKETVDFAPNYDESEHEPSVLPARVPEPARSTAQTGIAVGMATNIPPHNLTEVVNACLALLDDPALPLAALMQHMPGPDFPTAGIINGAQEIATAYRTGRGRLSVRARASIEDGRQGRPPGHHRHRAAVPGEQGAPARAHRATWCARRRSTASRELRDESDKDGMRVVIELKRGEVAEIVLNNLYAQTPMETVFGINMVALQDGQPKLLSLKEMLEAFIRHRREVVTRRTIFDLRQGARARPHPRRPGGRAGQHRRRHRAHQGRAVAGRGARGAAGARLAAGRRAGAAGARRRDLDAARRAWRPSSACSAAATGSPRRRRRPSSTCACTA